MANTTGDFVKWEDDKIVMNAIENVIKRYGYEGINESIDLASLPLNELRELATVIAELGYHGVLYDRIGYETRHILQEKLNKEFDRRLGEQATKIYNMMDKRFNREKWGGEVRYELMNLCNRKGYGEMGCLKNTVWYMHLVGEEITVGCAYELSRIMTSTLYWEFTKRVDTEERFDASLEIFKIHNDRRKMEIAEQDGFVNACLEQRFEDAYKFIDAQVKKELGYK